VIEVRGTGVWARRRDAAEILQIFHSFNGLVCVYTRAYGVERERKKN
jgi:hypothetical protein